jgi:hypothetical protein
MDDTLPTERENVEKTWPPKAGDSFVITLKNPGKPDSVDITFTGQTPINFEDVTFDIQFKRSPQADPEDYSPQGDDAGKVGP